MVDGLSGGRLEVGFARTVLPHEFAHFGIPLDESRARFDEGLEQVRRRLEEEKVTASGRFHSFHDVTSLPRPTQKPWPPFWIAALSTKESFQNAEMLGYWLMAIPLVGAQMASLLGEFREARSRPHVLGHRHHAHALPVAPVRDAVHRRAAVAPRA